jgi:protein subunit release factor A
MKLNERDIRIEQFYNHYDNHVYRAIHIPTGIVVEKEKSRLLSITERDYSFQFRKRLLQDLEKKVLENGS